MIRFERPDPPQWMTEEWQKDKGEAFAKKTGKGKFQWPQKENRPVNQHLIPILSAASANHCAYCDGNRLGAQSRQTIDHFRPKESFKELALTWSNLFLCCDGCQGRKHSNFSEMWLKPDEIDYDFDKHFFCNTDTGELEPQTTQAEETIADFDLNHPELMADRRNRRKDYENLQDDDRLIDEFPYRFFVTF